MTALSLFVNTGKLAKTIPKTSWLKLVERFCGLPSQFFSRRILVESVPYSYSG